jgi:hypothetical protein
MSDGFEMLGKALGGDSELAYEQGRALGAKTEDALAAARERVEKNAAKQRIRTTAAAAGVPQVDADLYADVLTAGGNLGDLFGGLKGKQEIGLRARASDPNLPFDQRNIALQGVAPGPVSRFDTVGKGHYQDKFSNDTPIDLGGAFGDEGGGDSAAMQLINEIERRERAARGDPNFNLSPRQAMGIARESQRLTDMGGVPGVLDLLDSLGLSGGSVAPPIPAPAPGDPPAPALPGQPRPAMPRAAAVAPVSEIVGNTAAVAAGKERGSASGRAAAGLPATFNTIDKFGSDIQEFLKTPGFNGVYGNMQGTGAGQIMSGLASQNIADAQAKFGNLNSQAFLASIQKMRGFGQLSNQEGLKVESALTEATNPKLSEEAAREAWGRVLQQLEELKRVAQTEANMGQAPAAGAEGGVMSLDEYLQSKGF